MRKSTLYLTGLLVVIGVLCFFLIYHPSRLAAQHQRELEEKRTLVKMLRLTDLCLFTEARYTRHLSQADLYAPFQDHPMSFEHFPSGSLTMPPTDLFDRGPLREKDFQQTE